MQEVLAFQGKLVGMDAFNDLAEDAAALFEKLHVYRCLQAEVAAMSSTTKLAEAQMAQL